MTARAHLLALYRRQGCDHAPVQFNLCPALEAEFRRRYGVHADYAEHFGFPLRGVWAGADTRPAFDWWALHPTTLKDGTTFNEWGVAFEPGSDAAMHMHRFVHPLRDTATVTELQAWPWPTFDAIDHVQLKAQVDAHHRRGLAVIGGLACTIWETAWYVRSMESLMADMSEDDPKAHWLLDRVTHTAVQRAEAYARAGCDLIELGDDVGTQSRLMMSRPMYRRWLMPRLTTVIRAAKAIKPDLLIQYHSCGYVRELIPDLIEAGIDILNPVQPESMDFAELHARFGDRLSFNGTVGTQTTMPFGSPDDVRRVVRENLARAGQKGGLLCCPTHLVEPEVPWENLEAYVEACREFVPA